MLNHRDKIVSLAQEFSKIGETLTGTIFLHKLLVTEGVTVTPEEAEGFAPIATLIASNTLFDFKIALVVLFQGYHLLDKYLEATSTRHLDLSGDVNLYGCDEMYTELCIAIKYIKPTSLDLISTSRERTIRGRSLFRAIQNSTIKKLWLFGNDLVMCDDIFQAFAGLVSNESRLEELDIRNTGLLERVESCNDFQLVAFFKSNHSIVNLLCDVLPTELQLYLERNRNLAKVQTLYHELCNTNLNEMPTQEEVEKAESILTIIDSLVKDPSIDEETTRYLINTKPHINLRLGCLNKSIGADDEAIAAWLQVPSSSMHFETARMEAFLLEYGFTASTNPRAAFISALSHFFVNSKFIDLELDNQSVFDRLLLNAAGLRTPPMDKQQLLSEQERTALLQFVFMKYFQEGPYQRTATLLSFLFVFQSNHIGDMRKFIGSTLPTLRTIPDKHESIRLNAIWQILRNNGYQLNAEQHILMLNISAYTPVQDMEKSQALKKA